MRSARFCIYAAGLLVLPLALAACDMGSGHDKVLGSVNIPSGSSVSDANTVNGAVNVASNAKAGDASTVNGSINVADGSQVADAETVNGSIKLGERATAKKATTVNGSVTLDRGATVNGDATTVNGDLRLAPGATVHGSLTNVNGHITVDGAHIGAGITTANGNIDITGNAVVDGGIKVEESKGILTVHLGKDKLPRIVVGPGATVNGPLDFERPVTLYISDQAHVSGPINGAQAVKFSGATPPAS
ncbi:MAG: hypothetical protein J0H50_13710 [Xanthomonadales bacterium]|nr:hypothetical protein [Xanthomonadales bacterium]